MSPERPSKYYDVIIVGMGPAGAAAAYELSKAGVSVLGLEKQAHPRYKVCGGGLSARISQILPSDFHSVVEETIFRVQFTYGGDDSFVIESSEPIAYMIMRDHFDQWLMRKALGAGTEVRENEAAKHLQVVPEGIVVTTARERYHSQYVIGADGAMSLVAQQFFPNRRLRNIPALESEVRDGLNDLSSPFGRTQMTLISLSAAKKGYGWIFPKRNGLSIGVGEFVSGAKRPKQSFQEFAKHEPTLASLQIPAPLGHPLPIFNQLSSTAERLWMGTLVNKRAVLVGDAGHLVDPLLGEGIYYAIRSGQLAARSISAALQNPECQVDEYERAAYREFGEEFQIASRFGHIIYGLPRGLHHWIGKTFPDSYQRVLHRYCQLLQGLETYQTLWARVRQRLKFPRLF